MDGFPAAGLRPARVLRVAGVVVAGLVIVAAAALAAVVLWLRGYAPLDASTGDFAPGPGLAAVILPATGSGGKEVFFPAYSADRPFLASFTLRNSGHFTVTVEGLAPATPKQPPWIGPTGLLTTASVSSTAPVAHTSPFQPLQLSPGDSTVLVARFRLACPNRRGAVPSVFADTVRLRYRYLRWFVRTQTVRLPFAVTLRCVGGPVAQP